MLITDLLGRPLEMDEDPTVLLEAMRFLKAASIGGRKIAGVNLRLWPGQTKCQKHGGNPKR